MGKRIILLSDGTGNSAAKVWRTNVWRVFESLDLTGSDQVALYDDGVGTSSFKPLAILGGAFGWGLKRNVLDCYKFVCRNYKTKAQYYEELKKSVGQEQADAQQKRLEDDEIFGFGFSRGAFTIRVVVGLIVEQGLVTYGSEPELDSKTKAAYRAFRRKFKSRMGVEKIFRWIRDRFVEAKHDPNQRPVKTIRFLGLWDSVAAYGLPVDEMTRGVSQWIWPLDLPDRKIESESHARLPRAGAR
jgi:uncharacterized protein (DUF2235 family)